MNVAEAERLALDSAKSSGYFMSPQDSVTAIIFHKEEIEIHFHGSDPVKSKYKYIEEVAREPFDAVFYVRDRDGSIRFLNFVKKDDAINFVRAGHRLAEESKPPPKDEESE